MPSRNPILQTALRAARAAGRAALAHFRDPRLTILREKDGSPVTAADQAADQVILRELRRAFPIHGILSEESGLQKGDGRHLCVSRRPASKACVTHGPLSGFARKGLARRLLSLPRRVAIVADSGDLMGYARVARGQVEAFAEAPSPEVWDLAAPRLIVEEAGGRFTNLKGEPSHRGPASLASSGILHLLLVRTLRKSR